MLTTFGTFWSGESFGIHWPFADVFLLILAALYLVISALLITLIKQSRTSIANAGAPSQAAALVPERRKQR